jgi:hypothetical protein
MNNTGSIVRRKSISEVTEKERIGHYEKKFKEINRKVLEILDNQLINPSIIDISSSIDSL